MSTSDTATLVVWCAVVKFHVRAGFHYLTPRTIDNFFSVITPSIIDQIKYTDNYWRNYIMHSLNLFPLEMNTL